MKDKTNLALYITAGVVVVIVAVLIGVINARSSAPALVGSVEAVDPHKQKNELTGEALKKQIETDLKEDIQYMQSKNPHDYTKGLIGRALTQFNTAYENDFAGGKIRVRVYNTTELNVIGMQFGVPEAIFKFTDNSYYIDAKTRQAVSKPLGLKRQWAIGMAKDDKDGQWKISVIMGAARDPQHP